MTKTNAVAELKLHRVLMSLILMTKNLRSAGCEHCEALLKDVYKCMTDEMHMMRKADDE